jgi:hypothetical protein
MNAVNKYPKIKLIDERSNVEYECSVAWSGKLSQVVVLIGDSWCSSSSLSNENKKRVIRFCLGTEGLATLKKMVS